MGDFYVQVAATGGHGCMREVGDGETVIGCDRPGCPDCITREYIRRLKRSGATLKFATLDHWPAEARLPYTVNPEESLVLVPLEDGSERQVVQFATGYGRDLQVTDDLLTGKRRGEFSEAKQARAVEVANA